VLRHDGDIRVAELLRELAALHASREKLRGGRIAHMG
jgi:hypothetical protein